MAELLLEILSEEIPARMQARAADDLKRLIGESLETDGLKFSRIETYSTPRRLTLFVDGLPITKPAIKEEKRGPRSDAPEKAITGFAKANRVSKSDLIIRSTEKGEFYFAVVETPEQVTSHLVPLIVEAALFNLSWPKSMRWGNSAMTWVRPIQNILVIFDGKPVNGSIQLGTSYKIPGLNAGIPLEPNEKEIKFVSKTTGHRFMAPGPFTVKDFKDYEAKLKQAKVILDPAERRAKIERDARALAKKAGLTLKADEGLLDEVAGLVEWPVALIGAIDEDFMSLPPDVLITAMRSHQKYFALEDANGAMAPRFITIADNETRDGGKAIVAGNERVLRARLADAKFFWDQDRKRRLEERVAKLGEVVFHAKLGTLAAKAGRMEALAVGLCEYVPGADAEPARTAARLSKADLVTAMVGEFPELQGVMGRYYALADGEPPEVADAIAEHYAPLGPGDECPTAPLSVAVALADKIDTLVGLFAIGEKPTGSRDPFALRRAALGVIRLIVENGLRLPLTKVFDASAGLYARSPKGSSARLDAGELLGFFADRLKVHLREKGVRHDLIAASFAVEKPGGGLEDDLVRLLARVEALTAFLESDDGADLLTAYKRASNIVRIEEKRDGKSYADAPEAGDFRQDEETALHAGLSASLKASSVALEEEDFTAVMGELAKLRAPVDAFFDEVTVNCDDPKLRQNRLRLLSRIRATLGNVADFSRIEG
ncbi:MAG: glycine--tRNA ligase subunit beta [Proteobacteria bacterium]|nr:glycine--tRNA ligase subunit beta [Pseudomonadota bacterium]